MGVTSFHEYLKLELTWCVECAGIRLNTAARLTGVDWATARRWRDHALTRWGDSLCEALNAEDVFADIKVRVFGTTQMGSDGSVADERWIQAASAAALLYEARFQGVISATEYRSLWWVRDRSRSFDPSRDTAIRDLAAKLILHHLVPATAKPRVRW